MVPAVAVELMGSKQPSPLAASPVAAATPAADELPPLLPASIHSSSPVRPSPAAAEPEEAAAPEETPTGESAPEPESERPRSVVRPVTAAWEKLFEANGAADGGEGSGGSGRGDSHAAHAVDDLLAGLLLDTFEVSLNAVGEHLGAVMAPGVKHDLGNVEKVRQRWEKLGKPKTLRCARAVRAPEPTRQGSDPPRRDEAAASWRWPPARV